jgi:hypothetical protein
MAPTAAPDVGRAYLAKKSIEMATELQGLDAWQPRSGFNILRRRADCVRAGADTDDVVGDIFGALRRRLGATCVAALCSSTAAAIAVATTLTSRMMPPMASPASC